MIDPLIYWLIFLKGSLFSTGGFANLPSVHQDLMARGWAAEADFGEALAIGQVSPGPNGLWVVSLGYLSYGVLGAALALFAITLPPLLVLVVAHSYTRVERWAGSQGAMLGVSVAVIGLQLSVIWTILHEPGVDLRGLFIAVGAFGLALTRKVNIALILALAGLVGYFIYR